MAGKLLGEKGSASEESSNMLDFDTAAAEAVTEEEQPVEPLDSFVERALVKSRAQYDAMYRQSLDDPEAFWGAMSAQYHWETPWEVLQEGNMDVREGAVDIKWFVGGRTNLCYNAVDRHVAAGRGDKVAIFWEGNDLGVSGQWTYSQLLAQVCRIANYLRSVGVRKGDVVTIYLPMVPELPAAMLACARIGAVHSVVFAGFSAEALAGRIADSASRVVLTASAVMRGTKLIALKKIIDEAVAQCGAARLEPSTVLVFDNDLAMQVCGAGKVTLRSHVPFEPARDVWWQDAVRLQPDTCPVEWMESEDPLFLLYTSGSTGKPKGVQHTTGGYMVGAGTSFKYIFDHHEDDVYWCTADCGWITGHTYLAYGPLLNGSSMVVFEGVPTHPDAGRCWDVVDKCITPLPGAMPLKPGCATLPFFGVEPVVLDEQGREIPAIEGEEAAGLLCIKRPWPSMMRTVVGDHARYETNYFAPFPGYYFSGDGCRRDADGFYWITGRVDDVINVSGHRIGTAEVESALVAHDICAEAAVVGYEHPIKGQGIYAFVTLMEGIKQSDEVRAQLKSAVRQHIGAFAAPDVIHWAPGLPKTRSGKIMRRVLRKIAANDIEALALNMAPSSQDLFLLSPLTSPVPQSMYPLLAVALVTAGLIATGAFFVYEATVSKFSRYLVRELLLSAIASVLLGFGTLFLFLWTGVYV
ncbi:unnamed protein product [Closterium sp. Yama58-4]|nr:unnamed protein product [Closterium sp. Yama58-4]